MSDWLSFLETLDFAPLVPEAYARYRPAVADGLGFYLGELSPLRAAAMLADQAALEPEAGIEARLVAFARHSPALHKLGQVMARDRRLPAGFRALLQTLETIVPPPDREPARAVLEAELGPLAALGIDLPEPPLAEASVAIVVPFARPTGGDGAGPAGGVFKVLKPGIEEALEEDLDILQRLGARLDEKCRALGLPAIDYGTAFARVRELLRLEVRLDREQANLAAARRIHAGTPTIQVPEPYPALSTPRVTAMRRVYGRKITEIDGLPAEARRRLAGRVVEALIAGPLWSPAPEALFHADPHAGNLMATPEGGLAILDWSLTGRLPKTSRESLTQILVSAAMLDGPAIARTIAGLAHGPVDETAVRRVVEAALGGLGPGDWPGLAWLIGLMDGMAFEARVPFDADLMMFRKALHTLHGVAADIDERFPADQALVQAFLARFGAEWTPRLLAPPFSRHFATHLSNADLATFLMATPLIASRYWLGLFGR
jgi:ubiquinone biosynthesis protein